MASTTLQKLYRELERRSTHDGLTGLLNLAAFDERLQVEFDGSDRHRRPLSLLMVDIDFFKRVNDSYGHQAGDRVLQSVANLLGTTTRPGDVVTRYGGEEFAIILPETDEASAMVMAERLRAAIESAEIECDTCGAIKLTISIGCASRRSRLISTGGLVNAADSALYEAKTAGRNRVVSANKQTLASDPVSEAA
jgi:two-component system, cell cycle response regulator